MHLDKYPFGVAALLGGLRQYLGAPSLRLVDIQELPMPTVLPGKDRDGVDQTVLRPFSAEVDLDGQQHTLGLMLYENAPRWAVRREHGLYRFLGYHLPILVPGFIAADPDKGWIVLEVLDDLRHPEKWDVDDYREAVDNLAMLHDRYWGLEEDLDTFDWLWRPLDRDYAALCVAIETAVQKLAAQPLAELSSPRYQTAFQALLENLGQIVAPLRSEVLTLAHGQYWAGTVARPLAGRQIVTYWRHAAIAPAILDVVNFHQYTLAHLKPALPLEAAIARYRVQLSERQGKRLWSDADWDRLWNHALLFNFAAYWLERLANFAPELYTAAHKRVESVWLTPTLNALEKYLNVHLPP